ncbi:molybdenum ABC transporter ATP-binding protein [Oleiagrimonas soli]|uniref:Molybdate transport system ATP-binding protein n=1 Tax=Oleiagrimonas soli TaxID=1543381 RepID=A0A099CUR5_9GAMM|nr:molybdenum ABC transporter ATP-binding protein [Oleiagrimonas soli]KGI76755.1 hypothetical protein LF63_0114485 [Oleiagrimonas soli]MBB6185007.1 molybdate transport system ATP-binding protein [Oleiagrimonas soli]
MTDASGLDAQLRWSRDGFDLDVALQLPPRGVSVLFGASGSGKTSCLRALAGLEPACTGRVRFGDALWQDSALRVFVPPHKRRLGYVVQDAGLFAHRSVAGNLDYGFRRAGRPAHLDRDALIDAFGVRDLLPRRVHALSGGQRQRVAIVRALFADPALLLFDEPLSALDAGARDTLLGHLETLHATLATPMVYVTHAIDEVTRLADHLVLLDAGRAVAQGSLQATLARLDLPPSLVEAMGAVIEGEVVRHHADEHLAEVTFDGGTLLLPRRRAAVGQTVRCRIGARDVVLSLTPPSDSSALNHLRCRITAVGDADHPSQCLVQLRAGNQLLLARITRRSLHALALQPDREVWAQVKAVALGGQ